MCQNFNLRIGGKVIFIKFKQIFRLIDATSSFLQLCLFWKIRSLLQSYNNYDNHDNFYALSLPIIFKNI